MTGGDPIYALLHSRKFLLLCLDAVVSLITAVAAWYLTEGDAIKVGVFVVILQPVFIAVINGIAKEDAAEKSNPSRAR
jgi:hypothetical protein